MDWVILISRLSKINHFIYDRNIDRKAIKFIIIKKYCVYRSLENFLYNKKILLTFFAFLITLYQSNKILFQET